MKKIITLLSVAAALGVGANLVAQDASTGQSTAPSSQTTANNVMVASNDGDLTQQLQTKFGQDPAFSNVQVSVTKGTATVTGSVPAKADKKRAKDLAKSIPGVKHVKDELTVNPSAGNSNHADRNNNPTNASVNPGSSSSSDNSSAVATSAPTPTNDQTSATSNNPNSQAAGTTGAPTTSAAAAPAAGENASSAPQNAGNAASENNLAGQGPVNGQGTTQSGPASTPGSANAAVSNPSSTQPTVAAGAIGANAGSGTPTPSSNGSGDYGVSINDTTTLQKQIQDAMQNEPTLHNDNVNVSVTDTTIELSGTVQNGKEKETARRIASSFAGNRRVKDRMTLTGKSAPPANPNSSSLGNNPASSPTNPANATNPNAQNPNANTPATNGDASPNPR